MLIYRFLNLFRHLHASTHKGSADDGKRSALDVSWRQPFWGGGSRGRGLHYCGKRGVADFFLGYIQVSSGPIWVPLAQLGSLLAPLGSTWVAQALLSGNPGRPLRAPRVP